MKNVSLKQARDVDHTNAYTVQMDGETHTVWTNARGEGLWVDGHQVAGTAEFSAGRDPAAAIRRYAERMA
jgi:hypothetical protein